MRWWHKWIGLVSSFFIIMFSVSGIFLNHRQLISGLDIPRSWMPENYRYNNWNNGAIKGSFDLSADSVLVYGSSGLWLTDKNYSGFTLYQDGFKEGADNRSITSIVKSDRGDVFAVSTFDLYRLDKSKSEWINLSKKAELDERISDLAVKDDSLFVMTRSHIYVSAYPYDFYTKIEMKAPVFYKKEASLFRTMWTLHSGELFHMPGRLFVDFLGLVAIFFCITGIIITLFPGIIKRRKKKQKETAGYTSTWKGSLKWHNKLGVMLLVFFLILGISGAFLRPPLLISIIRGKMVPIPGTSLASGNAWFDKLRTLRYDAFDKEWIVYSSEGFYKMQDLKDTPQKMKKTPPVSVMGVNVMEQLDSTQWVVGSFSGLFYWDKHTGESINAITKTPHIPQRGGRPTITNPASGYINDYKGYPVAFEYGKGAHTLNSDIQFTPMPTQLVENGRMSLWHASLEVHVGRIYPLYFEMLSDLFVFISGVLFVSILVSGYIVYRKRYKKRKKEKLENS